MRRRTYEGQHRFDGVGRFEVGFHTGVDVVDEFGDEHDGVTHRTAMIEPDRRRPRRVDGDLSTADAEQGRERHRVAVVPNDDDVF